MDAADIVFWLCALLNATVSVALSAWFRVQVKAQSLTEVKAKNIYSWLCVAVSLFSGVVLFIGITSLFDIFLGHGEILIASPIFNLLLSGVLITVGRTIIGWEPMKW